MPTLSLPEAVLLIDLHDERGTTQSSSGLDEALAGGLLLELALAGHLHEEGGVLLVADDGVPGEPLLADALAEVRASSRPRDARHWVSRLPRALRPLKHRVAAPLVERGVLAQDRVRVLGLVPVTRYLPEDPEPERALRARLAEVLVGGEEPDERTALLVGLLRPVGLVRRAVAREHRREAERRAEAIAQAGPVGAAVARHVREVETAVLVAVIASTAATAGSGGGDGGG
jgi:hypothetical protein